MKIGSINIRGLGSKIKKGEVKSLFYNSSLDFYCVQETKIESWSVDCGREIWGWDQIDYCVLNSEGRSGGILSFWNRDKFVVSSNWSMSGALVVNGI